MVNRESNQEKQFAENLDRLLAGQEIKTDEKMDDAVREELEFARKMTALRTEPSDQFASELRARLLAKLAAQEAARATRKSWFTNMLRQPVWQAAALLMAIAIIGTAVWSTGILRSQAPIAQLPTAKTTPPVAAVTPVPTVAPRPTATSAPAPTAAARIVVGAAANTDKAVYAPGERVGIVVNLKNSSTQPIQLDRYPPIVSLMRADTRQPVYTFVSGTGTRTLAPGETATFTEYWDQRDNAGQPVAPGGYYLELEDLNLRGTTIQLPLPTPGRFDIVLR